MNYISILTALILFGFNLNTEIEPQKSSTQILAFADAMGWAATTKGGRGGKIIKVTNLKKDGVGSFKNAVESHEPRIIVFEVGGIIDLDGSVIVLRNPYITIMGQTAPDPGITLIRGGMSIQTHEIIIQHIRVRPGENKQPKKSGWEVDGINTNGAHHVIIDHCSFSWATDENLSASGPRFEGNNLEEWRQNTSHTITFSYNVIAEGLSHSSHAKGEHSKGSLIHDNTTEIAIIANLFASNVQRNPFFKGGAQGVIVNNYIYNPGNRAIHYNLSKKEWEGHDWVTGKMSVVSNVLEKGSGTNKQMPYGHFNGPVEVFWENNQILGEAIPKENLLIGSHTLVDEKPVWPQIIKVLPTENLKAHLFENSGARPWNRDEVDKRIIKEVSESQNRIIDSENEVGGYPELRSTYRKFDPAEWDLINLVEIKK
ncbi:MAG: hypothetical protein KAQ79_00635 [Cyclobacteriaceae bacterium]|nr:hypothetical protein [Cyclobacteriaceae bacterium]